MEALFVIFCIAIGISIPCYSHSISSLKTARIVSKVYLIFAITLFAIGMGLFMVTTEIPYTTHETCDICGGSGIRPNGKPCLLCLETGEYVVSGVLYSIPLLYPTCMVALSIYTILLRFALQELIVYLDAEEAEFPDLSPSASKSKTGKPIMQKSYCKLHRVKLSNGIYCPYCMRILSPDDIDIQ